jgi:hypothetical protein
MRVLHNGRFSLPAGQYRIEVEWSGARTGETIGLQIGRKGDPWKTYKVEPRAGERWTTEFALPVDANFVGLRGTPELERVIRRIAIVPVSVVDAARRPKLPQVLGAFAASEGTFFFFDDNVFPEPPGFWVRGRRTTRVSIHRSNAEGPLKLRLSSGLIGNRLKIATFGWSRTIPLQPRMPEQVEIPVEGRALVTFDLLAESAFVPQETDPTSQDARELGIWIEVVP